MQKHLYELKQDLNEQGVFFCFSGPISQDLVVNIVTILAEKMTLENVSKSTIVRVFSMAVEKAQNILHYSDEKFSEGHGDGQSQELRQGIIVVGYEQGHYFVCSGNLIEKTKVAKLHEKLSKLQQMSKEDLKYSYKEQRGKGPEEGSKGAGLGFLEMAKKASKPIEFDFKDLDDKMTFFALKTVI
jgi:hypothetical protein